MPESKYLEFEKIGDTKHGKTEIWEIISKSSGFSLGLIKWYGPWRQYCFYPSAHCVFNVTCMSDISGHIKDLMNQRVNLTQNRQAVQNCADRPVG